MNFRLQNNVFNLSIDNFLLFLFCLLAWIIHDELIN